MNIWQDAASGETKQAQCEECHGTGVAPADSQTRSDYSDSMPVPVFVNWKYLN